MLANLVNRLQQYDVEVRILANPDNDSELGALDGPTMHVILDQAEPTITVFTVCHLFGHMIQLTDYPRYAGLVESVAGRPPLSLPPAFWESFHVYEREAFGYGRSLMSLAGAVDQETEAKYAVFMESDFAHFRKFITTGRRLGRNQFRRWLRWRYKTLSPTCQHVVPLHLPPPHSLRLSHRFRATIY